MKITVDELNKSFIEARNSYEIFDTNFWINYTPQQDSFSVSVGVNELEVEMKKFSIDHALCSHRRCLEEEPLSGNEQLITDIRDNPNLFGAAVLVPEIIFNNGPEAYIDRMVEGKISVFRMFPKKFRHSLKKYNVGPLLSCLEKRRIPLIFWHMEIDWDTVDEICYEYPELPVIIEGNDQKLLYHNRSFIPLQMKHKNLYFQTHNFIFYRGFEETWQKLKWSKFIFGSYFPYNDPNASLLMILFSDIPEEEKEKILSGNIRRLIQGIR